MNEKTKQQVGGDSDPVSVIRALSDITMGQFFRNHTFLGQWMDFSYFRMGAERPENNNPEKTQAMWISNNVGPFKKKQTKNKQTVNNNKRDRALSYYKLCGIIKATAC